MTLAAPALAALAVVAAGCGRAPAAPPSPLPPDAVPIPAGVGPSYRPPATPPAVAAGRPVGHQRCMPRPGRRFGAHVELIVRGRVLLVPAGIGLAKARRCSYPLLTRDPAGVVEVARGRTRSLGELFALWGQPLGSARIGAFRGRVEAFLAGRRWIRGPAAIPLGPHAVVVLELGRHVPPHAHYVFPPGL